jgi:hypothetical protein
VILYWLNTLPIWAIGLILLAALIAAARLGRLLRQHESGRHSEEENRSEGYSVTAILGLLALLTGFTFSLAIQRFEDRRQLVLEHANAIGTAYLRIQLLPEPHRTRMSGLMIAYTDNIIALAHAPPDRNAPLLAKDDTILTSLWAATAASYDSIKQIPLTVPFLGAMNSLIDMDGARRAARQAHVPTVVFAVLLVYLVGTAGVLGYAMKSRGGHFAAAFLLALLTLSQLLILDIDRPTTGSTRESQGPMENLLISLKQQPPAVFERWRAPARP